MNVDILSHRGTTRASADTEAGADTAMQIHALLLKTRKLQGGTLWKAAAAQGLRGMPRNPYDSKVLSDNINGMITHQRKRANCELYQEAARHCHKTWQLHLP